MNQYRIYLCSRVAVEAHGINNLVARALRAAGYEVFVPHEQHYNAILTGQEGTVPASQIFKEDFGAMLQSSLCVVVGNIGVDCAFEAGYFVGAAVPIVRYLPEELPKKRNPMLLGLQTMSTVEQVVSYVRSTLSDEGGNQ